MGKHKKAVYQCTTCSRRVKFKDGKHVLCAMHGFVRKLVECKDSVIVVKQKKKPNGISFLDAIDKGVI